LFHKAGALRRFPDPGHRDDGLQTGGGDVVRKVTGLDRQPGFRRLPQQTPLAHGLVGGQSQHHGGKKP
jgi:hypothetical protein